MAIADDRPPQVELRHRLFKSINFARSVVLEAERLTEQVGGQAAMVAALGSDATQATTMLNQLANFANAHKRTGVPDVSNPLS